METGLKKTERIVYWPPFGKVLLRWTEVVDAAPVDPEEAHPFVSLRRACHVGCGKCGFPADYPLHQKAA